jgi:YVTN family beta-propeller protein
MKLIKFSKVFIAFILLISSHTTTFSQQKNDGRRQKIRIPHKDKKAPVEKATSIKIPFLADTGNDKGLWIRMQVGSLLSSVGHLVKPAGTTIKLDENERVMNMALARNKKFLVIKSDVFLSVVDAESFKLISKTKFPDKDGGSMHGLAISKDDSTVYYTGMKTNLYAGTIDKYGAFIKTKTIDLSIGKKLTNPLGIGLCNKSRLAFVALAMADKIAVVDLKTAMVIKNIPVGICPYAVVISKDESTAFVSNFGGPFPKKGDRTENSAGSELAVDENEIALRGSVAVIDIRSKKIIADIITGIHPEAMVLSPNGKLLYVTDAGGDAISVIDVHTHKVLYSICTKPGEGLPYGSLTNALAFSEDGNILFAANAGNNSIAVIDPRGKGKKPYGLIPAGGFPGSLCINGNNLFIGNVVPLKGALQKVTLPANKLQLDNYTLTAERGFHLFEIIRAQAAAKSGMAPRPVPSNAGEPSVIKHVVYIIKENKKFDQVFGDFGKGNCDPKLVEFPRETTPNIHSIAAQFVLLDNYYCNGIQSNDGHQWALQGITTPYREKDYAAIRCAYDFGTDPLCYAASGLIWDHLLRKGISFRNFGELDYPELVKGKTWTDFYTSWLNKTDSARFKCVYQSEMLRNYSDLRFPGWQMNIPDQLRADVFINALSEYEKLGSLPEFIIIYLPDDHTNGHKTTVPTPRAYVADNDLATGRIIEALSKSSFWKDMTVFINEDDPQTGTDHVDGHRSYCLLAGPYIKRDVVISNFYNQSSVLHTICRIFGVPPMNQLVAMAPLMTDCFEDIPDYSGYTKIASNIALNEMNPELIDLKSKTAKRLAHKTSLLDFSRPDRIDAHALLFSKYVWSTIYGDKPFPMKYFGAHGKGLGKLGLKIDAAVKEQHD